MSLTDREVTGEYKAIKLAVFEMLLIIYVKCKQKIGIDEN